MTFLTLVLSAGSVVIRMVAFVGCVVASVVDIIPYLLFSEFETASKIGNLRITLIEREQLTPLLSPHKLYLYTPALQGVPVQGAGSYRVF